MSFTESVQLVGEGGTIEWVTAKRAEQILLRGLGVPSGSSQRIHCIKLKIGQKPKDFREKPVKTGAALKVVDCYRSEWGCSHILRRLRHGALVPWPAFSRKATA